LLTPVRDASQTAKVQDHTGILFWHAEVHFYDAGHSALETSGPEIGAEIRRFLARNLTPPQ
jgi:hypothetical protein